MPPAKKRPQKDAYTFDGKIFTGATIVAGGQPLVGVLLGTAKESEIKELCEQVEFAPEEPQPKVKGKGKKAAAPAPPAIDMDKLAAAIVNHAKILVPPKKGDSKKPKPESDSDDDSSGDEGGRREVTRRQPAHAKLTSLSAATARGGSTSGIEERLAAAPADCAVVTLYRAVKKRDVLDDMLTIGGPGYFVVKIPIMFTNMFTESLAHSAAKMGILDVFTSAGLGQARRAASPSTPSCASACTASCTSRRSRCSRPRSWAPASATARPACGTRSPTRWTCTAAPPRRRAGTATRASPPWSTR